MQTGPTLQEQFKQQELQPQSEMREPNPAEAMAYLRTRSMYVATPAYGGWLSVNYTKSLLALQNMCHEIGIPYTVSFKYNESLIPRARNAMVHDFLSNPHPYTDFFFIDADIGFDPRDVIMLMVRKEEVIGAPCVRKSFNWERVAEIIKSNGKAYTNEELMELAGEYVLNFPPDAQPDKINLGSLLEVQDVGTGLVRIRREVFEKLKNAFPEHRYMPMSGEGPKEPMFMFFQSGIDPESAKWNPNGLPDYIPEDFAFCRDCRKAGMKIHLAPWMKTSHMGSYMFQGDLIAVAKAGGKLR